MKGKYQRYKETIRRAAELNSRRKNKIAAKAAELASHFDMPWRDANAIGVIGKRFKADRCTAPRTRHKAWKYGELLTVEWRGTGFYAGACRHLGN